MQLVEIYCPKCCWRPQALSRWSCHCGHAWNLFDTGGICPRCGLVSTDTACPKCEARSAHGDWYHAAGAGGSGAMRPPPGAP